MGCCKSIPAPQDYGRKERTIYVHNLPVNISVSTLRREFKRFGKIRSAEIQVTNQEENIYARIEFKERDSVVEAIQESPLLIRGRLVYILEELRSVEWWLQPPESGGPTPNTTV